MAKWMVAAKKADFNKIAATYGITPVAARILRNREVVLDKDIRMFLEGTISDLHSPSLMKGMEQAAELLQSRIQKNAKIRVIGDYDVDGICSTYILCSGIRRLGGDVDRVIPHRIRDGYGLNASLIEDAHAAGIDTLITCDNGIAAREEIALAKQYGMTVIVTDHHEVPYEEKNGEKHFLLPPADALIDPKQPGETYPFPGICGAVVAYKLMEQLSKDPEFMDTLLPFAALATVCDVMDLLDENRIIVKYGLKAMERTENIGLKALLQVNDLIRKELTPYHAGFLIGPSLNATGRLDSADRALRLFEETDYREAMQEAADLKSLNDSRKQMTEKGVEDAVRLLEDPLSGEQEYPGGACSLQDKVLVIYLPDCHESIAGIIAGRIKEKYHKPVFILTRGEEGIKGSGRSIEAYSMYEEMTRCQELFTKFGGHKMAAGLSLPDEETICLLRQKLNRNCTLTEEDFVETVHIDVPMPMYYANDAFLKELSALAPFGNGNPRPLFAEKNVSLLNGRVLGRQKNVGKFLVCDERGKIFDMIYFGDLRGFDAFLSDKYGQSCVERLYMGRLEKGEAVISVAYYPEKNVYMGRETIQIVLQHFC